MKEPIQPAENKENQTEQQYESSVRQNFIDYGMLNDEINRKY